MSGQNYTPALFCPSQLPALYQPMANSTSLLNATGTSWFLQGNTAFDVGRISGQNYTSALTCPNQLPASYLPMANSVSPLDATGTSCLLPRDAGSQTVFETMQTRPSLSLNYSSATPNPLPSEERSTSSISNDLNSSICRQRIGRDWKPQEEPPLSNSYAHLANQSKPTSQPQLRMVLLGEKGVGKSSSGNTILGRAAFGTKSTSTSRTEIQIGEEAGRRLFVIESPAVFATETSAFGDRHEIRWCKDLCAPWPHVFLLVVRLDKHGKKERGACEQIQEAFGQQALGYTMVLFTHGDLLGGRPAEEHLRESLELVGECGGGHHVFNNKASDDRAQVTKLLRKIDRMVLENGGKGYCNVLENGGKGYCIVLENGRGYCNVLENGPLALACLWPLYQFIHL
ncbi:GTPase IMAP family member 2-like [Anguilla anguilla]|uniref:GTPase IMAP family member 2-like n=1 Tax=Anguilla anguilla TaxID=7936 RepID=UPI0015B069A7|nr:GTPase IMAP family member 2-like [Anguilla anguilla]